MSVRIVPAGESALIVEFEDRIDPAVNARAIALAGSGSAARTVPADSAARSSANAARAVSRSADADATSKLMSVSSIRRKSKLRILGSEDLRISGSQDFQFNS